MLGVPEEAADVRRGRAPADVRAEDDLDARVDHPRKRSRARASAACWFAGGVAGGAAAGCGRPIGPRFFGSARRAITAADTCSRKNGSS